jgi:hypothetical protein
MQNNWKTNSEPSLRNMQRQFFFFFFMSELRFHKTSLNVTETKSKNSSRILSYDESSINITDIKQLIKLL